jgi:hypothetical protein
MRIAHRDDDNVFDAATLCKRGSHSSIGDESLHPSLSPLPRERVWNKSPASHNCIDAKRRLEIAMRVARARRLLLGRREMPRTKLRREQRKRWVCRPQRGQSTLRAALSGNANKSEDVTSRRSGFAILLYRFLERVRRL